MKKSASKSSSREQSAAKTSAAAPPRGRTAATETQPVTPARGVAKASRRGLGRGLSALIPEGDLDLLSGVARGQTTPIALETPPNRAASEQGSHEQGWHERSSGASRRTDSPSPRASTEPQRRSPSNPNEAAPEPTIAQGEEFGQDPQEFGASAWFVATSSIEPNPFQPRQHFSEEELADLAASIAEHGVLQPVLLRPVEVESGATAPKFQLIAGERRWRAAQRAGIERIPAIVRRVDDRSSLELAIIENVQRHDISAIESAQAYRRLAGEFGLSHEAIAQRVGKSRASVVNTMRLLDLPSEAIEALRAGSISEGHGRALLTASGEPARRALLRRALRESLSVREVERLAREANAAADLQQGASTNGSEANDSAANGSPALPGAPNADLKRIELLLQRALGVRLQLRARRRGGQMIIDFSSPEELQRLMTRMGIKL